MNECFGKGKTFQAEWKKLQDPLTGVSLTQLTDFMAHSFHIYFTNNGWYHENSKLLFVSDRGNAANLFSLELQNGRITQLSEFTRQNGSLQNVFVNPQQEEAYFSLGRQVVSIDLNTLEERILYEVSGEYRAGSLSCTADGKSLLVSVIQDLSHLIPTALGAGYVGFEETAKARPHCQILRIPLEGGEAELIHEENSWIGHVNASPTVPHLLTFCHEGPWDLVDHRIWCLDMEKGTSYKIRPDHDNVFVGHEYWFSDGVHIGYHGYTDSLDNKEGKFIGSVKYDNSDRKEFAFPFQNMHIHSNDTELIVGDGQQASAYHGQQFQDSVCLWKNTGHELIGPRILCKHRGSFHIQKVHVHPRFSPDGKKVLFTSDMSGYGNLYLADVPEFESLPELPQSNHEAS